MKRWWLHPDGYLEQESYNTVAYPCYGVPVAYLRLPMIEAPFYELARLEIHVRRATQEVLEQIRALARNARGNRDA